MTTLCLTKRKFLKAMEKWIGDDQKVFLGMDLKSITGATKDKKGALKKSFRMEFQFSPDVLKTPDNIAFMMGDDNPNMRFGVMVLKKEDISENALKELEEVEKGEEEQK